MLLKKLILRNYMSIEELEMKLDKRGLLLVEGDNQTNDSFAQNGSGKTSLIDGISVALFEKTSRGLKAGDIVRRGHKNMEVTLQFSIGTDEYTVSRYRKHKTYKDDTKLYLNGEDISLKSTKDTNKYIIELIGFSYDVYVNSIAFGQGDIKMFSTATDKEKKTLLENMLNLQVYVKAHEIAKAKVVEQETTMKKQEQELERLTWELEQVAVLEQADVKNYEEGLKKLERAKEDLQIHKNIHTEFFTNVEAKFEELDKEIQDIHTTMQQMQTPNAQSSYETYMTHKQSVNTYTTKLDQLRFNMQQSLDQQEQLKKSTNCPTCGSLLDQSHRVEEEQRIQAVIVGILEQFEVDQANLDSATNEMIKAENDYNEINKRVQDAQANYKTVSDKLMAKQSEKRNYEHLYNTEKAKQSELEAVVNHLQVTPPIERESERNEINEKIVTKRSEIEQTYKKVLQAKKLVEIYSNSGVKSHVLDTITPYLNERANHYLAQLSGADIEVEFSTQKKNKDGTLSDKFEVRISNTSGGDSYTSSSTGERKRIDLAISLALQDVVRSRSATKTNLITYDEVFDGLDTVGCENVIQILNQRVTDTETILVITHNEHLKPLFTKSVTMVKKDGVSSLREEDQEDEVKV